ncbi:MAG: FAD-linked oxidase C-terminal domain-containing protein, partial [Chloroflexota bacterium]
MREISEAVMALAMKYDGTTTGEHGEGFARSIYNEQLYGERLHTAFRQVKGIFDERNTMNPGKIIDAPAPWDASVMRLSPEYVTPYAPNTTFFDFSVDGGFTGMVEMCNGQGACRKTDAGVMCPSYMATRDEAHSTRGRANALRAAISGGLGAAGLLSDELDEVMDLCLGCKACKRECPSMVDMAKLKYEYLAQRQAETGVSLSSWAFGNIALVNRIGALPGLRGLTNWSFKNTAMRQMMRWALGIDIRRELPAIASQTFREWFNGRATPQPHLSHGCVLEAPVG